MTVRWRKASSAGRRRSRWGRRILRRITSWRAWRNVGTSWSWLRSAGDTNTQNPPRFTADSGPAVESGLASAAKTVTATYKYHYNGFMEIGPHCAVADIHQDGSGGTIFLAAQSINGIPAQIQPLLAGLPNSKWTNTPAANYRIVFFEGASSFGGGIQGTGGVEPAEMAAVISAMIGKPMCSRCRNEPRLGIER